MRPVLFLVLLVFCPHLVNAQETIKYWIFLTDKYKFSSKHTQVEDDHLSGHAVARHIQRGTRSEVISTIPQGGSRFTENGYFRMKQGGHGDRYIPGPAKQMRWNIRQTILALK